MSRHAGTIVRAFDGSLADARGLLDVERATFNECPYSAEEVRAMLSAGPQQAWLAITGDKVDGFVVAFPTHRLSGPCWEIDLLAVHPDSSGRGLGTRLIRTAAAHGVGAARRARAVVAADNPASARAFMRAGFRRASGMCNLLIYRTQGLSSRPPEVCSVFVREATCMSVEEEWLAAFPTPGVGSLVPLELRPVSNRKVDTSRRGPEEQSAAHEPGHVPPNRRLLLAEEDGRPAGYAELVPVQTLLYRGEWIETLVAPAHAAREALVDATVNRAETADLDEVGAMVPEDNWLVRQVLLSDGFRSLGEFYWLVAELPLPGWAGSPESSLTYGVAPDRDHG